MRTSLRFTLSFLVAAAFLFASGGVLFAAVLSDYFRHAMGHLVRPPEDFRLGIVVLEKLVQAFFLAAVYARLPRRDGLLAHGVAVGACAGLLIEVPWGLSLYGNYPVSASAALVFTAIDFARIATAVVLIALVQGARQPLAAEGWGPQVLEVRR
jgi:hypothetical protein